VVREIPVLPDFEPRILEFARIPAFQYLRTLKDELSDGNLVQRDALNMLEWMMSVRAFEQMIIALRLQAFAPLREMNFRYRGPTLVAS